MSGCCDIYTTLTRRRLMWFGHTVYMENVCIPKQLLFGELANGKRNKGRPLLRNNDVCKRDITSLSIISKNVENLALDRPTWHRLVYSVTKSREHAFYQHLAELRQARKVRMSCSSPSSSTFICSYCARQCHSQIGLFSHQRLCRPEYEQNNNVMHLSSCIKILNSNNNYSCRHSQFSLFKIDLYFSFNVVMFQVISQLRTSLEFPSSLPPASASTPSHRRISSHRG